MSDAEEHDFDLSKLARRLSISSDDWQSDSSSQHYNWAQCDPGSTRPSPASAHSDSASPVGHTFASKEHNSAGGASIPSFARDSSRTDRGSSGQEEPSLDASLATSFPFLPTSHHTDTSASRSDSASATPTASSSKQSLAGLGLSNASDAPDGSTQAPPSRAQGATASSFAPGLSASTPASAYSSHWVPLPSGSHLESLVDPQGSASGSTARFKPRLQARKTVGGSTSSSIEHDALAHSTGSYSSSSSSGTSHSSAPKYALYRPQNALAADSSDDPASLLKEKRESLRSSIAWDDFVPTATTSSDPFGAPADPRRRSITRSPSLNTSQHSHHTSASSPRMSATGNSGSMRSPSLTQRPSLSRGSSGSFTRDRSGSLSRRVSNGHHSRSSSRASLHLPAGASPVVSRRISSHRSAPTYVKGKALSLEPAELMEIIKEEHHRMLDPAASSERMHKSRPLVIDTRPLPDFLGPQGRIKGSINCNFPSLLIKRFKRGKIANFTLESFITTETGKRLFQQATASLRTQEQPQQQQASSSSDETTQAPLSTSESNSENSSKALASFDIFIVDERIGELDGSSTGSILVSVLEQVVQGQVGRGSLCYLHGPFSALAGLSAAEIWIVQGEDEDAAGLASQSQNQGAAGGGSSSDEEGHKLRPGKQLHIRSPPRVSSATALQPVTRATTSESPERTAVRKSSKAQLRRLDTGEGLSGNKSASLGFRSISPAASRADSDSLASDSRPNSRMSNLSLQELCRAQAKSPHSTAFDSSITSRRSSPSKLARAPSADGDVLESRASSPLPPDTATEEGTEFLISTVIPGFMYLGPEPRTKEDIDQLKSLGVQQILNMALEIDEGALTGQFEKYVKIPMRDFVDETGVQGRIDEACGLLDDADLKSKAVYVHCRAGKSRSVTIVLAYLIHRYHWTLSRAYEHVSEKRKGISPNIGFMSELMRFEERELGTKTAGVNMASSLPSQGTAQGDGAQTQQRQQQHRAVSSVGAPTRAPESAHVYSSWGRLRDSMPPIQSSPTNMGHFSGDREQEVKGHNGAWVHARRDQMSERFQPNRRASKAGLESN